MPSPPLRVSQLNSPARKGTEKSPNREPCSPQVKPFQIIDDIELRTNQFAQGNNLKPILYADINLGSKGVIRVPVHKGDKPGKLADVFSKQHGLSVEKKVKLMLYLNLAIEQTQ